MRHLSRGTPAQLGPVAGPRAGSSMKEEINRGMAFETRVWNFGYKQYQEELDLHVNKHHSIFRKPFSY